MIAFEISHNGKKLCVAGLNGNGVLSAIISRVSRSKDDLKLVPVEFRDQESKGRMGMSVSGLATDGEYKECHLRWDQTDLIVGDQVSIRIVESRKLDLPKEIGKPETPESRIAAKKKYVRRVCAELGWEIVERPKREAAKKGKRLKQ